MPKPERTGNTWRVRHRVDGRQVSRSFPTKVAAGDFCAELEGRDPPSGILFTTLVDRWMRDKRRADSTITKYRWLLDAMLLPTFGHRRIRTITHRQIVELLDDQLEGGRSWDNVRAAKSMLCSMFKLALREGDMNHNPADFKFTDDPRDRRDLVILEHDQVAALAAGVGEHWRALVITTAATGLRWGESTGLWASNINLERARLDVDKQMARLSTGELVRRDPKSKASRRAVPIFDDALPELTSHLQRHRRRGDQLVFTSSHDGPLAANAFYPTWDQARRDADLPTFRWHDFRHVAASRMLNAGFPINEVSRMLGHARIQITIDTYGHLQGDHIDRLHERARALGGLYAAATE